MGTVFKKQTTRPLPRGAETFTRKGERFARWKARNGKARTAPLTKGKDGAERIITESPFYVAKYRDGSGVVQTVSTGCKDETAARQWLANLERRAERITAGMMTPAEDRMVDHLALPIETAFEGFDAHVCGRAPPRFTGNIPPATCAASPTNAALLASPTSGATPWNAGLPRGQAKAWQRRRGTSTVGR